jgi:CRP/FNR family cyclic AMP-dependent transcriptional regulator
MAAVIGAELAHIPLFAGLSRAEEARLAAMLRPLAVPKHTNLMALEQPGDTVYAVVQGTLRVQVEQEDGALVILAFLGAGDTVGEMGVLEATSRSATVVAVEPCRLLWLDRVSFDAALSTMPGLSRNLLLVLSRRLRLSNERIQVLARLHVSGRVAHQLVALAEAYGEPLPNDAVRLPLRITQAELADIVGASRERVNQVLRSMAGRGLLETSPDHRWVIPNLVALRRQMV